MGNRAVITLANDETKKAVYVHWNGGPGSVRAFVEETKKRLGLDQSSNAEFSAKIGNGPEAQMAFYGVLFAVCSEFFSYSGAYMKRSSSSVYMENDYEKMLVDNGVYILDDELYSPRFELDSADTYEQDCYKGITEWFENMHIAKGLANDNYKPSHGRTPEVVKDELQRMSEVAQNTINRMDTLKAELKDLTEETASN